VTLTLKLAFSVSPSKFILLCHTSFIIIIVHLTLHHFHMAY